MHFVVMLVSAALVFAGFFWWGRLSRTIQSVWMMLVLILIAVYAFELVRLVGSSLRNPPIWDFRCFWLFGRVALTSHEIYSTTAFHAVAQIFPFNAGWSKEVLDVGFIYPPPSIVLFAPLGLFSTPNEAAPWWFGSLLLELVAAIVLLWRGFFREYAWAGLAGTTLLVLSFPATYITISYAQTPIFLLLLVSLYAFDTSPFRRGIWLGVAAVVKPISLILLLQPVLQRAWRPLVSAVAVMAAACVGAILIVGFSNVMAFFSSNVYQRDPGDAYTEDVNQSLLAFILRLTHQHAAHYNLLHEPLFLALALAMGAITLYVCGRFGNRLEMFSLGAIMALALMIYPGTWVHYAEILLLPLLALWVRAKERSMVIPASIFIIVIFSLVYFSVHVELFAYFLCWLGFLALLVKSSAASSGVGELVAKSG